MAEDKPKTISMKIGALQGRHRRVAPEMGDKNTDKSISIMMERAASIENPEQYLDKDGAVILSIQEEDFCLCVANGYSLAAAAREAYGFDTDAQASMGSDNRFGSRLAKRPRIALRIKQLIEERRRQSAGEAARLRSLVMTRLEREALNDGNKGSERIKALQLLGQTKEVGIFADMIDPNRVDESSSASEIQAKLLEHLRNLEDEPRPADGGE